MAAGRDKAIDHPELRVFVAVVFARLLILLAVLAGLALGSGPARELLGFAKICACCPSQEAMPCCTSSHSAPPSEPATTACAPDFKQAPAPALHLLGIAPQLTSELPSAPRHGGARPPGPSRLALLCTRLI